ncbi:SET domain-containing protein SmydA-8-like [Tigriopus californicus]|nr:SET domain-containing protein SmydA-8-like [Tigriopus californicus]|eukprot:TCALIF_01525-PA protein Name:"Similar to msta Protein msta, isoform B (Drosophila melanogaster)" AED:0.06 eAED:0.06 QI:106/1/1/1/1/1/8/32/539
MGTSIADEECFFCQKDCSIRCSACGLSACSPQHLTLHRPKAYCFPFRIQSKPEVGRYIVATRSISPLEVILEDDPAVFGPNHDTEPVCLECLVPVDGAYLCSQCHLPLCGDKCDQIRKYHARECQLLSQTPKGYKMRVDFNRVGKHPGMKAIAPEYCCISPLRLLALKAQDPELWDRVQMLMDHDDDRRKEEDYWKMFQVNAVDFLRQICGFDFTEEEIFRATGIIRTNAFHVQHPYMKIHDASGGAVFPTFSFLSHSCLANARYSVSSDNHLTLRAQREIPSGAEITIQYLSFMFGDLKRKCEIQDCWFFQCTCPRCDDPTECGSYLSALRCQKCTFGPVLTSNPRNLKASWSCQSCQHKMSHEEVDEVCTRFDQVVRGIKVGDVEAYETTLERMLEELQPTHYLVLTVKKYLCDFYGFIQGYKYDQLPVDKFEAKIRYGEEFLATLSKVDPGCPKWKGLLLFDLHKALMIKSNADYNQGQMSKDDFLLKLKQIQSYLAEARQILDVEPDGTRERHLASQAQKAKANIDEILLFSNFI